MNYIKFSASILLIYLIALQCNSKRLERALIFPPTTPTRCQVIYGIGVPLDLDSESLTTGYVLKAEYFLPTKAIQLHPDDLSPQSINKRSLYSNQTTTEDDNKIKNLRKSNEKLSRYRWAIYKAIETIIDRTGLSGRACMLRSICEAAEIPFHYHSGLLGEFMHILMSPSSSVDQIVHNSDNQYYQAEKIGQSGAPCGHVFKECRASLLNKISGVYTWSTELLKYI